MELDSSIHGLGLGGAGAGVKLKPINNNKNERKKLEFVLLVTAFSAPASSGYSAAYACVGNCGDFS